MAVVVEPCEHTTQCQHLPWLFFLFSRVLQRASRKRREVTERHVRADVRPFVHAELRAVQGPLRGTEAILRRWQRQPGGDAQWVLGALAGAHVPAGQPPVSLHRWVPRVCQQVHRAAEALWGCAAEAQATSDASIRGRPHLCAGPCRREGRREQSVCGELRLVIIPMSHGPVIGSVFPCCPV